jgi:hypothetical protein
MTPDREIEVQKAIIRAMSAFGVDVLLSHQSMGFTELAEMRRDISISEFVSVLKSMEGVIFDFEAGKVRVPIGYFTHP